MIRLLYWWVVLVELLLLLGVMVLFIVTDSRTIKLVTDDLLKSYELNYADISGNLFTGIEVRALEYQGTPLLKEAKIHWNPFGLIQKKVEITELNIQGLNPKNLNRLLLKLQERSNQKPSSFKLLWQFHLHNIDFLIDPFTLYGIDFGTIHLEGSNLWMKEDLTVRSDLFSLSLASEIANIRLKGIVKDHRLKLDRLILNEIDPNAIVRLVKNIKRRTPHPKASSTTSRGFFFPIKGVDVRRLVGSMKPRTYGRFKIKKAKVIARDLHLELEKRLHYRASEVILDFKSNWGETHQRGEIRHSMLLSKGMIHLSPRLIENYHLPLRYASIKELPLSIKLNHQGVWADITHRPKDLLLLPKVKLGLAFKRLHHHLSYRYLDFALEVDSTGLGSMAYAKHFRLRNHLKVDFHHLKKGIKLFYKGGIHLQTPQNMPHWFRSKSLDELDLLYDGDRKGLAVSLQTSYFKGHFKTQDYKQANLELQSKKMVALDEIVTTLPQGVAKERGVLRGVGSVEFTDMESSEISLMFKGKNIDLTAKMNLHAPYSLDYHGYVALFGLGKLHGRVGFEEKQLEVVVHNKIADLWFSYLVEDRYVTGGELSLFGEKVTFDGRLEDLHCHAKIKRLNPLLKSLNGYYGLSLPLLSGRLLVDANYDLSHQYLKKMTFKSHQLSHSFFAGAIQGEIHEGAKKRYKVNLFLPKFSLLTEGKDGVKFAKVHLKLDLDGSDIVVQNYDAVLLNNAYLSHIQSTKPSFLAYTKGGVKIKKFWINDELKLTGYYHPSIGKGSINMLSEAFTFKHRDFDLLGALNLKLDIEPNQYYLHGAVHLLGNQIRYELRSAIGLEDSDIIILQEQAKERKDQLTNLKTYITLENDHPLNYKTQEIDIDLLNNLTLVKGYGEEFHLLGESHIVGGYFEQEGKRFYLEGSKIYFYGDLAKPLLEIKARYQKDQYTIRIYISGSSDDPIINFSSNPYLSQRDILSLILFDSAASGGTNAVYAMLGGAFAKELMKGLGVEVDHLLLGEGIDEGLSVEVGQKISEDITVMYQHENGKDGVKVRLDHGPNFETDIIIQPPNTSSIEFFYTQD